MTDIYSKAKRSEIMSRVKNRRTGPEDKVAALLRELGLKYRRNVGALPSQPDFVVRSKKTVIFVNGCFWHGHLNCNRAKLPDTNRDFWEKKITTNKRRDCRNARKLRGEGWRVINVWQCRLRKCEQVRERLARLLGN